MALIKLGKGQMTTPVFFAVIFILIFLCRFPACYVPFHNVDEAGSAVIANVILDGGVIYKDVFDHRGPMTGYLFALIFALFGRNDMTAVHFSLIAVVWVIAVFIYLIARSVWNRQTGYWAVLLFSVFSFTFRNWDFQALNTEWLGILFECVGIYALWRGLLSGTGRAFIAAGLCWGLAFFTRQQMIFNIFFFMCFGGLFVYGQTGDIRKTAAVLTKLVSGFLAVGAAFVLYFLLSGTWDDFCLYFWKYNVKYYLPSISIFEKIRQAFGYPVAPHSFFSVNYALLILFVTGCVVSIRRLMGGLAARRFDRQVMIDVFFAVWGLFAYAIASLSGKRYGHYYVFTLAAFCLVGGCVLCRLWFNGPEPQDARAAKFAGKDNYFARIFIVVFLSIGFLQPFSHYPPDYRNFWERRGQGPAAFMKKGDLFSPEVFYPLSRFINETTDERDRIFVWGMAPQIYVLSDRMPASKFRHCNALAGNVFHSAPQFYARGGDNIVPGSWDVFMEELRKNAPVYFIDMSGYLEYENYPPERFGRLDRFLKENYVFLRKVADDTGRVYGKVYKRK